MNIATKTAQIKLILLMLGLILGVPNLTYADYKFKTIDVRDSIRTGASGNSEKQIVGDYDDTAENTHGFVLSKN